MLRDWSDREPEPPRWRVVVLSAAIGIFVALIAFNALVSAMAP